MSRKAKRLARLFSSVHLAALRAITVHYANLRDRGRLSQETGKDSRERITIAHEAATNSEQ